MNDRPTVPDELKRLAEAAAWRTQLTEEEAVSSAPFEAWLAADPHNAAAWNSVEGAWNNLGEQATSPELIALRRAALDDARRASKKRWVRFEPARRVAVAAVTLLAVLVGAYLWVEAPDSYATALGERRVVTLEDGSRIALDSGSRVRVGYSNHGRDLQLLEGQARFNVMRDVQRPFSVQARDRKVVATGTAFNIDLSGTAVLITLIEGQVVVFDAKGEHSMASAKPPPAVELRAGQQMASVASGATEVRQVSIEHVTAWENGQLVFENEPLSAVVARVSRYTRTPVSVDGPAGNLQISGVFNTGDLPGFVDALTHYLPVRATTADDGSIRLARSP